MSAPKVDVIHDLLLDFSDYVQDEYGRVVAACAMGEDIDELKGVAQTNVMSRIEQLATEICTLSG